MDPNTTIVRVKRKWGTDPADALLLACKRIRPEASATISEEIPEPREEEVENSVFKLVATVATQDALVQTQVRQALLCDQPALCPSADSSKCIIGDLSSTKWSTRQEDCFRVISSYRTALSTPAKQQNPPTDVSQNIEDSAKEQDRSWATGEILVVDLEQDQEKPGKTLTLPERLCVSEDGLGEEHCELEGEYVYDLYYQETATPDWIHDILPAKVYDNKGQLVPNFRAHEEEEVYEELCEYEDNESEESNWRKDYSDEESDEDSDREERDGGMNCAAHVFIWPLLTGCVVWLLPGWQF